MKETYTFQIVKHGRIKIKKFHNWIIACIYCWFVAPKGMSWLTENIALGATEVHIIVHKESKNNEKRSRILSKIFKFNTKEKRKNS